MCKQNSNDIMSSSDKNLHTFLKKSGVYKAGYRGGCVMIFVKYNSSELKNILSIRSEESDDVIRFINDAIEVFPDESSSDEDEIDRNRKRRN